MIKLISLPCVFFTLEWFVPIGRMSIPSQKSTLDRQHVSVHEAGPIAQQIDDRFDHLANLPECVSAVLGIIA